MSKFLGLVAGLFSVGASAAVDIKHQEFLFALGGDWVQVKSLDPEQFSFESKEKKSSIVLSVLPRLNIPKARLVETAKKFAEIRKNAELRARPGQSITFGDEWVELKPSGDVAEVAYAAYDDQMIFRFFGFVTQAKVISFWVSTTGRDNDLSKRVFDEAYKGLKFYVP